MLKPVNKIPTYRIIKYELKLVIRRKGESRSLNISAWSQPEIISKLDL